MYIHPSLIVTSISSFSPAGRSVCCVFGRDTSSHGDAAEAVAAAEKMMINVSNSRFKMA